MTTSAAQQPAIRGTALHPDPAFPVAHPRPATGWLNDPNGLCRVDGVWHVFFQFNPYSAQHERIHWGHLSSPDLVEWAEEPVALAPSADGPDRAGCWSGVMGFDDDAPIAVYSGVQGIENASEVTLAQGSDDLRRWSAQRHVAAPMPQDDAVIAVRDPFLVTIGSRRWALQGAGLADGQAAVLLYDAEDLWNWTYHGVWLRSGQAPNSLRADIWECPQLIWLEESQTWVLVVSRWHRTADGGHRLGDTHALLLEIEDPGPQRGLPTPHVIGDSQVDSGDVFYAPQILAQPDRAVLIGWAREIRSQQARDQAGWAGLLTWPRELSIRSGRLVSRPAPECDGWRTGPAHQHRSPHPVQLPQACDVVIEPSGTEHDGTEADGTKTNGEQRPRSVTLQLVRPAEDGSPALETVFTGRADRIVIDHSIVEVFCQDGAPSTLRVESERDQLWQLDAAGQAVSWWELRRWIPG